MNSRERVLGVFAHAAVDRVPCWCGMSDEFRSKAKRELGVDDEGLLIRFRDDFRRVFGEYVGPEFALSEGANSRTIFGVERDGIGYGQPLSHPLAEATIDEINAYAWPDPEWIDVSKVKADAQKYDGQYAILGGDWSPFWHDAIDLFGMEALMIKMYTEPDVVDACIGHMVDYYAEVSKRVFDAAADEIDIFFIGNDLGSSNGPLLGPQLFERFVLPHLVRLIDLGHSYGLQVQMHCCGGFEPLLPDLIEANLDGVHAIQPACTGMDLTGLKQKYGDKIVFNGAIDSHHILIEGNPESVRQDTRKVLEIMKGTSGYIAGASHDTILEETPVENVTAMFDAIYEFGEY